jgi:chaperonin GroES
MDEAENTTKSGLILPDEAKKESTFGTVVATGRRTDEKGEVIFYPAKPGERVLVTKYGGTEVKVSAKTLKIFQCDDILAVIEVTAKELASEGQKK